MQQESKLVIIVAVFPLAAEKPGPKMVSKVILERLNFYLAAVG